MARLQVLYLPSGVDGETVDARFAIVADQAGDLADFDCEALRAFADQAGAQGCLVVSGVLDVHHGEDDDEAVGAVGDLLRQALTAPDVPQPAQRPAPKLPPPTTTEGKLARVLGGQKILDQMKGSDPQ